MRIERVLDIFGFLAQPGTAELLARGVESMGGRLAVADVLHLLHKGNMQIWAAHDDGVKAVLLTEIVQYPCMRVLRCFGLSGSGLLELAKHLPVIEAFAREMGCKELDAIETRAGLELAVPGFRRTGVCLVKPIASIEEAAA